MLPRCVGMRQRHEGHPEREETARWTLVLILASRALSPCSTTLAPEWIRMTRPCCPYGRVAVGGRSTTCPVEPYSWPLRLALVLRPRSKNPGHARARRAVYGHLWPWYGRLASGTRSAPMPPHQRTTAALEAGLRTLQGQRTGRLRAQQRFPGAALRRKKDYGRAKGLLLAYWGWRYVTGHGRA